MLRGGDRSRLRSRRNRWQPRRIEVGERDRRRRQVGERPRAGICRTERPMRDFQRRAAATNNKATERNRADDDQRRRKVPPKIVRILRLDLLRTRRRRRRLRGLRWGRCLAERRRARRRGGALATRRPGHGHRTRCAIRPDGMRRCAGLAHGRAVRAAPCRAQRRVGPFLSGFARCYRLDRRRRVRGRRVEQKDIVTPGDSIASGLDRKLDRRIVDRVRRRHDESRSRRCAFKTDPARHYRRADPSGRRHELEARGLQRFAWCEPDRYHRAQRHAKG